MSNIDNAAAPEASCIEEWQVLQNFRYKIIINDSRR